MINWTFSGNTEDDFFLDMESYVDHWLKIKATKFPKDHDRCSSILYYFICAVRVPSHFTIYLITFLLLGL